MTTLAAIPFKLIELLLVAAFELLSRVLSAVFKFRFLGGLAVVSIIVIQSISSAVAMF